MKKNSSERGEKIDVGWVMEFLFVLGTVGGGNVLLKDEVLFHLNCSSTCILF